ncbi:MAG: DNA-binding protein [Gammaproteobacteria bacterium]|jgi:nucleoid DNA-binding protein|nr:DNA-binding protein [Gammaproteobacteria bacterium]MBT4605512.1 DNA-binding protein [Thiotrichales bacterium]MBT3472296.1 DNA-binding protein [Gammaproteobacteria bacterium]MBT3968325.1 DNA-binding protein [Gammaproteobacteria bacterium]MBT4079771.1 DNA-binding protein [Gammaproteobacteria bacterium]
MAPKITAVKEAFTKAQTITTIAEDTGLSKKAVSEVLDSLGTIIERHVKPRSAGRFALPGIMTIKRYKKKATKAREGRNPQTGETITIAAKPAHNALKITPAKALKDIV